MTKNSNKLDGWIVLDKPTGMSSAHAVTKVKKLLKPSKIGHAGTLDPLASGILPLALGEATKTMPYMVETEKAYTFTVTWGEERDTDDCEGKATFTSGKLPTQAEIEAILGQFTGKIQQTPPIYSAIKVDGERAYALARAGEEVALKPREIMVYSLEISEYCDGKTTFICRCGKGTYIRSLARDMGRVLGCFGYITMLRRLKVGHFQAKHAISLEVLGEMVHKGRLDFVLPVESVLDDIPALEITSDQVIRLKRGQSVSVKQTVSKETVQARHDGKLIALCNLDLGEMKPVRVFNI